MIKLHLGCGTKHIEGYTNIDARYLPGVDEVNNIKYLRNYKQDSVDVIYACHVLEHVGRYEVEGVLKRWFEILKPGGTLRLAVPDFESIIEAYHYYGDLEKIMGLLYGGQDYEGNFHYTTFDFQSVNKMMENIGFKNINRYDRDETEHADIDDFSASYIPHMDREGMLMSLNVEATKPSP